MTKLRFDDAAWVAQVPRMWQRRGGFHKAATNRPLALAAAVEQEIDQQHYRHGDLRRACAAVAERLWPRATVAQRRAHVWRIQQAHRRFRHVARKWGQLQGATAALEHMRHELRERTRGLPPDVLATLGECSAAALLRLLRERNVDGVPVQFGRRTTPSSATEALIADVRSGPLREALEAEGTEYPPEHEGRS